jgi:hypothetical protein
MGKISRKKFVMMDAVSTKNATSHLKFVKHVEDINKFLLDEVQKTQQNVHFIYESLVTAGIIVPPAKAEEKSNDSELGSVVLPDQLGSDVPSDSGTPVL